MAVVTNTGPQIDPGAPGLLTIEGMWEADLAHQETVRPLAELLRVTGQASTSPVRNAATFEELSTYLALWTESEHLKVLYLACHGEPGAVSLDGTEPISLSDLATSLGGRAKGRYIHIASCSTLAADENDLREFCRVSGVSGLSGYTTQVDWTAGAAFDFLLLGELLGSTRTKATYDRMVRVYPDLAGRLGLRMATSTWVS